MLLAVCLLVFLPAMPARAAAPQQAQDYLDEAPASMEDFLADPLGTIFSLLGGDAAALCAETLRTGGVLLLYLVLCAAVILMVPGAGWHGLLENIAAGGSFLLLADPLLELVSQAADQSQVWQKFLAGYIPVFAALCAAAGEASAAALCNGFFYGGLYLLAEGLRCFLLPAAQCYLAAAVASVFSSSAPLADACAGAGRLLRRAVGWAGAAFTALLGLQRVLASTADSAVRGLGRTLLSGAVPIVGEALTAAADTVWLGVKSLQAGLGFAALALLGVQFLPLYGAVLAQLVMAEVCGLAARLLELEKCGALFRCLAAGLSVLAALLALFFGMVLVGLLLLIALGKGG